MSIPIRSSGLVYLSTFSYTDKKKTEADFRLVPTSIFFRLRAVIPLYLLVPSYVALRGN